MYIVISNNGYSKRVCATLDEAVEIYLEECNAYEFVEITDNRGNSIERSW